MDLPAEVPWKDRYPFHADAQRGNAAGLAAGLAGGADVNALDDDGWAPLHYASWYGHEEAVRTLLGDGGAAPSLPNAEGVTALHFAAGGGHAGTVRLLLTAGADRAALNGERQTPAALAEQLKPDGWANCVSLLSE